MEFRFNVNEIFKQPIVEIGPSLIPPGVSYSDKRALWDAVNKVSEIVNTMGEASAMAQGLNKPITTSDRLRNSEQKLYLLIDRNSNNGRGAVTGMLKTGKKGLYVFDREGHHYQVQPSCVLDFYIHESKQRMGLGKVLFEHMLAEEKVEPVKLAIDRPSDKFLGFLNKHYALSNPVRQMNNFVVFDGFFPEPVGGSAKGDNSEVPTIKSNQAANGLQSTFTTPYGRYGAPRPPCSMGQIIHNQSPLSNKAQEPTGTSLNIKPAPKIRPDAAPSNYHGHTRIAKNVDSYEENSASNIEQMVQEAHSKSVVIPPAYQQQQSPQQTYNYQMQHYPTMHSQQQYIPQQESQQYVPQQIFQQTQQQLPQQIQQVPQQTQEVQQLMQQAPQEIQQVPLSYQQPTQYQQQIQVPQEILQSHAQQEQFRTSQLTQLTPTQQQTPQINEQQDIQKKQQEQHVQSQMHRQQQQEKLEQQQLQQQQQQERQKQQQQQQQDLLRRQEIYRQQLLQQQKQQQRQGLQEVPESEMKQRITGTVSESQVNYQQLAQPKQYIQPPYEGQMSQQREQPTVQQVIKEQPNMNQQYSAHQMMQQSREVPVQQLMQQPIHYQPQQNVQQLTQQANHYEQLNQQQMIQQPTQQMMQQPVQQRMQQPVQQMIQQPTQQMMQQPTQQIMQKPTQQMMQQPTQQMMQPTQQIMHQPAQQMIQQPTQHMMHQPIQQMIQQPTLQMMQQPTDLPVQQYIQSTQQVPVNYMQSNTMSLEMLQPHTQQSMREMAIPSTTQINTVQPTTQYQSQVPIQQTQNPVQMHNVQAPIQMRTIQQPSMQQLQVPIEQISNQQLQYPVQNQTIVHPSGHQIIHVPIQPVQQVHSQPIRVQQVPVVAQTSVSQLQTQIPTQQQVQKQMPQVYASQPNMRANQHQVAQVAEAQSAVNTATYNSMQNPAGQQLQQQQHRTQVPPQTYVRAQETNKNVENMQGNTQVSASYSKVGGGMNNVPNAGGDMQPIEAR